MFMAQQPLSAAVVKNLLVKPSGMTEQQGEVWQCLEDFLEECNEEGTSVESYGLCYNLVTCMMMVAAVCHWYDCMFTLLGVRGISTHEVY